LKPLSQTKSSLPKQSLEGTLERITFQNNETGYSVARLIPRGKRYEVTIVGNLAGVNAGESLRLQGWWINHPQYGRQFEFSSYTVQLPATIEGIRKYLGSGLIKGIGPVTANRIVNHFGIKTLSVIEDSPQLLKEVEGVGEVRTSWIVKAWEEQKQIKEIMVFLQGHGISTGLAVKIFKQYQDSAIQIVSTDPYRLAKDIFGIGFKTADTIAHQMGLSSHSPTRLQAGLLHTLRTLSEEGHCYATQAQLTAEANKLLEVGEPIIQEQLEVLISQKEVVAEDTAIYLPPFLYAEQGVASKLHQIQLASQDRLKHFLSVDWQKMFTWLDHQDAIRFTDQQRTAIQMALTQKISILTGGPGTGKSTITSGIIRLLRANGGSVVLAAPTGRAAKRLGEATGLEAKTIHRLLEYNPLATTPFTRDHHNPLDADLIIIDEMSMVDILLMYHLLNAIEVGSHLLFVGDDDQLPSVGPGNVLRDLITSETIAVTRLDTIFRQPEGSLIIVNAHRINHGEMPLFSKNAQDFFLFPEEDPQKAADWVIDLVTQRIPNRFHYNPQEDIQVLSPMHRGAAGVRELNQRLQALLNPPTPGKPEIVLGHHTIRQGDRVMQIRNNYERRVFNGDLGRVILVNLEDHMVTVEFDSHLVDYDFSEMDELIHAYAASIHKAQGSEFPVVVIPLLTQHYRMLQRNLLYTGVTRARRVAVLVGSKKAIYIAVKNDRVTQRNTRLAERLKDSQLEKTKKEDRV